MKKIQLILKGLLLYITVLYTMLFICCVDSLNSILATILSIVVNIYMIIGCFLWLSEEDLLVLSGYKWFIKLINGEEV